MILVAIFALFGYFWGLRWLLEIAGFFALLKWFTLNDQSPLWEAGEITTYVIYIIQTRAC